MRVKLQRAEAGVFCKALENAVAKYGIAVTRE